MNPQRKVVTGVQARALAALALHGSIERTLDQGSQLGVTFNPAFVPGELGKAHVIIGRTGRMRSVLPANHPVRRRAMALNHERKFGHLEVAA